LRRPRAFEETAGGEAESKRAAEEDAGTAPSEVLRIIYNLAHVTPAQVLRDSLHLISHRLPEFGSVLCDRSLVLIPQAVTHAPESVANRS
jgi:hypothetical protein